MPGIFGLVTTAPPESAREDLTLMGQSMCHRPYYRGGVYEDPASGVYLGWWAHPGSYCDGPPIISREKDLLLLFNGEHFSSDSRNGSAKTAVDQLAPLLELKKKDILRHLNGWFCGVLLDLRNHEACLFNDRYGMSRLYWHEGGGEILFASEAKAMLKIRPHLRALDEQGVAEHLAYNAIPGQNTLFKNVYRLPAGAAWKAARGKWISKDLHFDQAGWNTDPPLVENEFFQVFSRTVSEIINQYAQGLQQVGFSLTGGFDTRLIMAGLADQGLTLPCYTFGGPCGETLDMLIAKEVAAAVHVNHSLIRIGQSFFDNFADYAHQCVYVSDGTHGALGAHDVYFNRLALEVAPVRLTGKFGSEVVRIRKLHPRKKQKWAMLQKDYQDQLENVAPIQAVSSSGRRLEQVVCSEIPTFEFGRLAVEQAELVQRTPFMDNRLVDLMRQAPETVREEANIQADYIKSVAPELGAIKTNMFGLTVSNQALRRALYLVLRLSAKMEYFYLTATPHWATRIDRKINSPLVENIFSGRQKFEKYRIWTVTKLGEYFGDMLGGPNTFYGEIFDRKMVAAMLERHLAGTHNYLQELNKVLTVELIGKSLLSNGGFAQSTAGCPTQPEESLTREELMSTEL